MARIQITFSFDVTNNPTQLTVFASMKLFSLTGYADGHNIIVGQGNNGQWNIIYDMPTQSYAMSIKIGGTWYKAFAPASQNMWQLVTGVYDRSAGTVSIYIDGQLIDEVQGVPNSNLYNYADPYYIGGQAGSQRFIDGLIDNVHIWNTSFDSIQIQQFTNCLPVGNESDLLGFWNFEEGNGTNTADRSSNSNDGTLNGGITWSTDTPPFSSCVPNVINYSNTGNTVPAGISYQAIARNAQGQPLSNTALQVKFTLLADSLTGTAEYIELHSLTTNDLGLFTTAFGTGTPISSAFANINWAAGNKYLKVEIDGGNGFVNMGTQQLLSVPYSMRSNTSAKAGTIENAGLPIFANNAAAITGGLQAGQTYRTPNGVLMIVY